MNLIILTYFLFVIYLCCFSFLAVRLPFFSKTGWSKWLLAALFLLKVGTGLFYGWIYSMVPAYETQADTWRIYFSSLTETSWLKKDPAAFFGDLFTPRYQGDTSIVSTGNSFWNDIKEVLVIKLAAIFNLLSGNNYWINCIFFQFLSFFGPLALARVWLQIYPGSKWPVIAGCFLVPSVLFWTSGFHKDGLLLTALGMITWWVQVLVNGLKQKTGETYSRSSQNRGRVIFGVSVILFHLFLLFLLRNYLAALLLLALLPWILASIRPGYSWQIFIGTYLLATLFFFLAPAIHPRLNLPAVFANRQKAYLLLKGESLLGQDTISPDLQSFAAFFPKAASRSLLRPFPWEMRKFLYIPAALEVLVTLLLAAWFIVQLIRRRQQFRFTPFILFNSFLALSVLLVIGYTIPFLGAIVRYKAVAWPFLLTPLLVAFCKRRPASPGGNKK